MSDVGQISTVEHQGFQISASGSPEASTAALNPDVPKEGTDAPKEGTLSKAASELGKKGGQAAAAVRKSEAKKAAKEAKEAPAAPPEEAEAPAKETKPAEAETDDEEVEERKSRAKARVEEATREAARYRREAETLRRELEDARRTRQEAPKGNGETERRTEAARPEASAKPKADDYATYDEYLDARDSYNRQTWEAEHAEKSKAVQRADHIHTAVTTFSGRVDEMAKTDDSFMERTAELAAQLQPSFMRAEGRPIEAVHVLTDEIIKSEQAPGLMLHFAENPADFERIKSLHTREDILRAVVKIEARLEGATAGNPPPVERQASKPDVSKAPPPVRPVTGAPSTAVGASFREGMSFDEWNSRQRKR
jgi:hypothetical protein